MSKPFKYRVVTEWSDEDEAFIARVPALPGCAAHGDTVEKAGREARSAALGIIDVMRAHGDALPPEDASADYSGQLRLRLPKSMHERISRMATADGVSLNTMLLTFIAQGFGGRLGTAQRAGPNYAAAKAPAKRKAVA